MKSYILNYRINGRERRAAIARTSEISLKIAREWAGDQPVRIRAGEADPLESKRAAASGIGTHVLRVLPGHKTTAMADRYIRAIGDPVREARE